MHANFSLAAPPQRACLSAKWPAHILRHRKFGRSIGQSRGDLGRQLVFA